MAWIEVHQSLHRHPKLATLISELSVDRYKLIGHMVTLWCWSLDVADDTGKLPDGTSDVAIADGCGWPMESAKAFVKALRKAGFMEKRGYRLHDWNDYTWRYHDSKKNASGNGAFGNHKRWHLDKGVVNPECDFCRESSGRVGGDIGATIASESHPPTLLNPPNLPTEPSDPPTATNLAALPARAGVAASPFNLQPREWNDVYAKFPNESRLFEWFRDWVDWNEKRGVRVSELENKAGAFIGFVQGKTKALQTAAGAAR